MRRADRLFQIVQYLQGRRLTTAAQLATWLQVSERTIYRDIQSLSTSGVPVEAEAGVGYRLRKEFNLPPLMFTEGEIQALTIGARMVGAWSGDSLGNNARSALAKISAALPSSKQNSIDATRLYAPMLCHEQRQNGLTLFDQIHSAIQLQWRCQLAYTDGQNKLSERQIWPLALYFWGYTWTLGAWCEQRQDFRNFRLDRIMQLQLLDEHYPDEAGKRLADFVQQVQNNQHAAIIRLHAL